MLKEYEDLKKYEVILISGDRIYYYFIFKAKVGIEPYEAYDVNFCFEFFQKQITEITGGYALKRVFTYDKTFYFKHSLSKYDNNEENTVMLNFNYPANSAYDRVYCKFADDSLKDEKLLKQMSIKKLKKNAHC